MKRPHDDLAEELQEHFAALVEEGVEAGLTREEARRRARLRLGDTGVVAEKVREGDWGTMIESWYRDFRLGLRSIRRNPVFAITAVLTLGVGIGANTAIFTLLHGLLLRSLPVHDPGQLARVGVARADVPNEFLSMPYAMVDEMSRRVRSFEGVGGWIRAQVTWDAGETVPRLLLAGMVSGNSLEVLGVKAYLGRQLTAADDVRGGGPNGWPAMLDYRFWMDSFGGDPGVVGRQLRLANTSVTVVGITAPSFRGVWAGSETKLYLPMQFFSVIVGRDLFTAASPVWVDGIARLKPGASHSEAQTELNVLQAGLFQDFIPTAVHAMPWFKTASLKVSAGRTGLPTFFGRVYSTPLYLMQGLVAIVLLLCCVNVGGLMMAKVHARNHEFAIRTAIGAARQRLIRQYLTESFVIALAGAALGAAAAWWGTAYLLPYFRHPMEGVGVIITPDRTVLWLTGGLAVLTTLLFGTLPAWRAGGADPGSLLKSRTTGGARRQLLGRAFIPVQVGLSFALVSIAALLSQSLMRLETEQTGFDLDHVTIQTAPLHTLNKPREVRIDLYRRMRNRLEQLPGVNAASYTWTTPMTGLNAFSSFQAVTEGANPPEDAKMPYNDVGPGYFKTMHTTILQGREFDERDRDRSVCVLNQAAAAFLFPGKAPVGQYVRGTDEKQFPAGLACRVVGLARDAKFSNLDEAPPRTIYFPATMETLERAGNLVFLINSPTKTQAIAAYKTAKSELLPSIPFAVFVTLREQMDAALGSQRAMSVMSGFFAAMALFLSGLGLYGLLSASVAQRTSEIGVRMAMGASKNRVLSMILREALLLLGIGLVLGAGVLAFTVRYAEKMLYGVSASDPVTMAVIAVVLAMTAIAAGLIPALRAASIDPITALRS